MKRLGFLLLCVAIGVFFLARGDDPTPRPDEAARPTPVVIPLPPLPPAPPPSEQARGLYVFDGASVRLALTLEDGGRFRLVSTRNEAERRVGEGTWNLDSDRLTLVYRLVNGEEPPDGPVTVVNRWSGRTLELRETGQAQPVVLRKRTMLRSR